MGAGHGEERTENILVMVVTLEVSKLSGWSNANAPCRESKGGHLLGGELREGRWQAAGKSDARSVQARALQIRGQGTGRSAPRTCRSCV